MNRNALVAILGVLLAGSVGYNAYQFTKGSKNSKDMKTLAEVKVLNDSLQKEIKRMQDSLGPLISGLQEEKSKFTARIEELESAPSSADKDALIGQLQARIANLQALSNTASEKTGAVTEKIAKGQKPTKKELEELTKLKEELATKIKEIEDLKQQLALATQQRDAFESEASSNRATVKDLNERIKEGAFAQFGSLRVTGMAPKSDGEVETLKAKSITRLKISCDVLSNPLITEPIDENVTIRIIGPDKTVLADNSNLEKSDELYTLMESFSFDGGARKLTYYYPSSGKINKLKKGVYNVELKTRDLMRLKYTFELN